MSPQEKKKRLEKKKPDLISADIKNAFLSKKKKKKITATKEKQRKSVKNSIATPLTNHKLERS